MKLGTSTILFGAATSLASMIAIALSRQTAQVSTTKLPKFLRDLPPSQTEKKAAAATSIKEHSPPVDWGLARAMNAQQPAASSAPVDWTSKPTLAIGPARITSTSAADAASVTSAPATRAPSAAARELYALVTQIVRAGDLDQLGTKGAPNPQIAILQRDMRGIRSDGVYGPKTAARGKELLGREFPARTPPANRRVITSHSESGPVPLSPPAAFAPPATAAPAAPKVDIRYSPQQAAEALYLLVTSPGVDLGTRDRPNVLVEAAQHDMGGLVADGVYGPKTAARGTALTHKKFPKRA